MNYTISTYEENYNRDLVRICRISALMSRYMESHQADLLLDIPVLYDAYRQGTYLPVLLARLNANSVMDYSYISENAYDDTRLADYIEKARATLGVDLVVTIMPDVVKVVVVRDSEVLQRYLYDLRTSLQIFGLGELDVTTYQSER